MMESPEIACKKCRKSIDPIYEALDVLYKFDTTELSKLEEAEKVIILEICPFIVEINSWMSVYEYLQSMDWSPKPKIEKCLTSDSITSIRFSILFSKIHNFKCIQYKLDPLKTFINE